MATVIDTTIVEVDTVGVMITAVLLEATTTTMAIDAAMVVVVADEKEMMATMVAARASTDMRAAAAAADAMTMAQAVTDEVVVTTIVEMIVVIAATAAHPLLGTSLLESRMEVVETILERTDMQEDKWFRLGLPHPPHNAQSSSYPGLLSGLAFADCLPMGSNFQILESTR